MAHDDMAEAIALAKDDHWCFDLGGFTIFKTSKGSYDYLPKGYTIPPRAQLISKWRYEVGNKRFVCIRKEERQ